MSDVTTDGQEPGNPARLAAMEEIEAERKAAGVGGPFNSIIEIMQSAEGHVQIRTKVSPSESFVLLKVAEFELLRSVMRSEVREQLQGLMAAMPQPGEGDRRIIVPAGVGVPGPHPS